MKHATIKARRVYRNKPPNKWLDIKRLGNIGSVIEKLLMLEVYTYICTFIYKRDELNYRYGMYPIKATWIEWHKKVRIYIGAQPQIRNYEIDIKEVQ